MIRSLFGPALLTWAYIAAACTTGTTEPTAECEEGAECAAPPSMCTVGDRTFAEDEAIPSMCTDEAISAMCTCLANGVIECVEECSPADVDCTKSDCNCGGDEWWRQYYVHSSNCSIEDFVCEGSTIPFRNACGCGCSQSADCAEVIDCRPPNVCDLAMLENDCPFSTILD